MAQFLRSLELGPFLYERVPKQLLGGRSLLRVFLHAVNQEVLQFNGTFRHLEFLSDYLVQLLLMLNVEWVAASEELVCHGSQSPNIDLFIVL